jgi:exodeoxyribonuclease VII small subunit
MAENTKPDDGPLSFEEALGELEALVERMEEDQLPLEELVADYERGHKLQLRCEALLNAAKQRLEMITLRAAAEIPLDSRAEPTDSSGLRASEDADDEPSDDEIRLF